MAQTLPTARSIIVKENDKIIVQVQNVFQNYTIFRPTNLEYYDLIVRCQRVINHYGNRKSALKTECELALADGHDYLIIRVYQ